MALPLAQYKYMKLNALQELNSLGNIITQNFHSEQTYTTLY